MERVDKNKRPHKQYAVDVDADPVDEEDNVEAVVDHGYNPGAGSFDHFDFPWIGPDPGEFGGAFSRPRIQVPTYSGAKRRSDEDRFSHLRAPRRPRNFGPGPDRVHAAFRRLVQRQVFYDTGTPGIFGNGSFIDLNAAGNFCWGAVGAGTGPDERIGSSIAVTRITLRGFVYFYNSGAASIPGSFGNGGVVRMIVVHDLGFKGVMPVPSDIISDGNGSNYADGFHFVNPDNTGRFRILDDRIIRNVFPAYAPYVLVTQAIPGDPIISTPTDIPSVHATYINIDIKCHVKMSFDDTGADGDQHVTRGAIYILAFGVTEEPAVEQFSLSGHGCCVYEEC